MHCGLLHTLPSNEYTLWLRSMFDTRSLFNIRVFYVVISFRVNAMWYLALISRCVLWQSLPITVHVHIVVFDINFSVYMHCGIWHFFSNQYVHCGSWHLLLNSVYTLWNLTLIPSYFLVTCYYTLSILQQ